MSEQPEAAQTWAAIVVVPAVAAPAFEEALAYDDAALSSFELTGTPNRRVEAIFAAPPPQGELQARIALAATATGIPVPALSVAPLPDKDWVAESQKGQPPVRAGRFFIYGPHSRGIAPPGATALEITAGRAFGTGQHQTTLGCLITLDRLAKRRQFRHVFDLGCGSGVLALAAASVWRRPVLASDIDPWAARMTEFHARRNHLGPWLRAVCADGLAHPAIRAAAPFDLIFANILAGPLEWLAQDLRRHAMPGARIVLAGLLNHQERQVRAAYIDRAMCLEQRLVLDGWTILTMAVPD